MLNGEMHGTQNIFCYCTSQFFWCVRPSWLILSISSPYSVLPPQARTEDESLWAAEEGLHNFVADGDLHELHGRVRRSQQPEAAANSEMHSRPSLGKYTVGA